MAFGSSAKNMQKSINSIFSFPYSVNINITNHLRGSWNWNDIFKEVKLIIMMFLLLVKIPFIL